MTIKFSDEIIQLMTDRFLGWSLPRDFNPDAGIRYTPGDPRHQGPSGTNLFDATQAEAMVRYMVEGLQPAKCAAAAVAANGQVEGGERSGASPAARGYSPLTRRWCRW